MKTGGHTDLGRAINKLHGKQQDVYTDKVKIAYGIIKDVIGSSSNQGVYTVILEIVDKDGRATGRTGPIVLQEHPGMIAANYGSPMDLIEKYICKVEYRGTSVNRGVATIIRPIDSNQEMVENFNKVEISGMSFAPPGSGIF